MTDPAFELARPFPTLQVDRLTRDQRALWEILPISYQKFLQTWNGGFVPEEDLGGLCFHTGVPFYEHGLVRDESQIDELQEFYGFRPCETTQQGPQPHDLAELKTEYDARGFLPLGVIAIATSPESSLVCISTRREDHGAVYYWDYYWDYPWSEEFFDPRVKGAERSFPNLATIQKDPKHPQHQEAKDALNYSTLVFLAADFDTWLRSCWWDKADD